MMLSKWRFGVGLGVVVAALSACDSTVETEEPVEDGWTTTSAVTSGPTTSSGTTSAQSSTSSGSAQTTGAGGDGGAGQGGEGQGGQAAEICAAMEQLALSDVVVISAGDDDVWEAGEQANLQVTMTNLSFSPNLWYPGVAGTSDNPLVTVGENTLFGIEGASSTPIDVIAQADAAISPGTQVELTFTVTSLNQECEGLATATAVVTIE